MVKIISDSTCDLSRELLEKHDITILPLHIVLGDKEYLDGVNITPDEIYQWSDANKTTPKTSAASMEDVTAAFAPYVKEQREIVCFCISGEMSVTANVMRMAARELEAEDLIHVIDSRNLSTGIGLQVLEAAEMAEAGKSGQEIEEAILALQPKVRASFVVDTLTYLYRGGRSSGLEAMAVGMLKLHPKIEVKDGVMGSSKKYRGKIDKVILSYARDMEEDLKNARAKRVFITHSGCEQAVLDQVREYVEGLHHFDEILMTRAGSVISSHCRPGTLGVLFIAE